jgi:hypothetical protein
MLDGLQGIGHVLESGDDSGLVLFRRTRAEHDRRSARRR